MIEKPATVANIVHTFEKTPVYNNPLNRPNAFLSLLNLPVKEEKYRCKISWMATSKKYLPLIKFGR